MKRLTIDLTYPGATVHDVASMLGDPAFREAVGEAQHVVEQEVTVEGDPAGAKTVRIEQVQATAGVPGFAKKIVGDRTTIISDEKWSAADRADLRVSIPGKPGEMNGSIALAERDGGVVEHLQLDIEVKIPLVGGKVEGLLADLMTKALERENQVGQRWLSDQG